MERSGDVQRNGPLYPISLRELDCFADVLHFPGQNNLTGRIYICYVHISLLGDLPQNPFIPANKRSHGSRGRKTSLFHVQAPIGDQSKPGQKVECSCCSVCGELPERQSGSCHKVEISQLFAKYVKNCNSVYVK